MHAVFWLVGLVISGGVCLRLVAGCLLIKCGLVVWVCLICVV